MHSNMGVRTNSRPGANAVSLTGHFRADEPNVHSDRDMERVCDGDTLESFIGRKNSISVKNGRK